MIPNDALINALRSLNFSFKKQTDRMMIYKLRGSTRRVAVRRNKSHDEIAVRSILRQAGMDDEAIEQFIHGCNN